MTEYLNGTFLCIDNDDSMYFTNDCVYQFIDGLMYDDTGTPYDDIPMKSLIEVESEYHMNFMRHM